MISKSELSTRKRRVIQALVTGSSKQEAADQAGVSPGTVSRYLRDPLFLAALRSAQAGIMAGLTAKLTAGAGEMLGVLAKVATGKIRAPAGVRVRAAGLWLDHLWRAREFMDLSERVAALEKHLEAKGEHKG